MTTTTVHKLGVTATGPAGSADDVRVALEDAGLRVIHQSEDGNTASVRARTDNLDAVAELLDVFGWRLEASWRLHTAAGGPADPATTTDQDNEDDE